MRLDNDFIMEERSDEISEAVRQDEHDGEIIYYFRPKCYRPSSVALMDVINGLIFANNCSGGDLSRIAYGEIRIYFNPMIHCWRDRKITSDKIIETIKSPNTQL